MKDKEQVRSRILESALACFSEKGLAGTTMCEIAHRAGVSPGGIYLYFSSKQTLFDKVGRPELDVPSARARERRQAVIDAALKVFSQKGYAGASMDEVASAVGLSKAALYSHFDSKAELFKAVLHNIPVETTLKNFSCAECEGDLELDDRELLARHKDVESFLRMVARLFFAMNRDPQRFKFMRIVMAEGVREREVADFLMGMIQQGARSVAFGLGHYGFAKKADLHRLAEAFMGLLFAWLFMHRIFAHRGPGEEGFDAELARKEEDAIAERAVRLFLDGARERGEVRSRAGRKVKKS